MSQTETDLDKKSVKKNVILWSMYDLANTIFSMGIVSLTVIKFFTLLGMRQGLSWSLANFLASFAGSLSTVLVAITVPFLGALSDRTGERKSKVIVLGALCILSTALVFFLYGNFWIAFCLFIIANVTYQWANLFYDAMIPHICSEEEIGKVSAFGVAVGYFGSFIALGILMVLPLVGVLPHTQLNEVGEPLSADGQVILPNEIILGDFLWMWLISAVAFLIMAIPFLWVKERTQKRQIKTNRIIKETWTELKNTTIAILKYPDMLYFIVGWILTVDVVNTIISYMLPAAEDAWGLTGFEPLLLIVVGVIGASILTYFIGPVTDKRGPKVAFLIVGLGYIVALFVAILADATDPSLGFIWKILLFIVALIIGGAQGSTWVASRSMVIELAPPDKVGQYFAYSKLVSKGGSAIGLFVFGSILSIVQDITNRLPLSYRVGFIALTIIYIIGLGFLMKIQDYHPRFLAGERAPYDKLNDETE